jgi:hypothetical protein
VNLVVVSNRVARGKPNEPMTGGLAAALLPVVEHSGAIWVGSSGRVRDGHQKEPFAEIEALGSGAIATLDLPAAHYGGYYEGFANSALWPALHSRSDLIRVSRDDYVSYREVNAFMARALMRFRKAQTAFWVQDYHFLALGAELRDLGVTEPIGFFLHTPWPSRTLIAGVPHHRELIQAMLAYDLIGFQTEFRTITAGTGLLFHVFDHYGPKSEGAIAKRQNGVMISNGQGPSPAYSLVSLQERGRLLISEGDNIYEGQLVGIHAKDNDLTVNALRAKQLTNIRAAGKDDNVQLTPPIRMSLEQALEFIEDDELVEVTPKGIRLRKKHLTENDRKRASRQAA